jgi:hypothetical protein
LAAGTGGTAVPSAGESVALLGAAAAAGAALAGTVSVARLGVGLVAVEAPAVEAPPADCEDPGVAAGADTCGAVAGISAVDAAGVLVVLEGVVEPGCVELGCVELGCVPSEVCAAADGLLVPAPSHPKP